uniref:Uncharacterized protein n=1 Tax=viral metagenome TaxID=1070528 RepID=A0A6C0EYB9_9ZZZZ
MSSSLGQGEQFINQKNNRKSGKSRYNQYQNQSNLNNRSVIEAFSSNSTGASNPSTTSSASSSKTLSIPAEYKNTNINRVNTAENANMKRVIKDVNKSVNHAGNVGNDTLLVAKSFNKSNDKNSLKNSDITTANGLAGNVNAMGIFSTYSSDIANNLNNSFNKTDLNVPASMAQKINQNNNPYPIITSGNSDSNHVTLFGQPAQMPTTAAQNNIGQFAGQNVYVYDRNPITGNNIYYQGNYTSNLSLSSNNDMGNVTAKQCFERAADNAGGNSYGYAAIDSNGNCYTGLSPSGNWQSSYSKDIELCDVFLGALIDKPIVLGANGGLYVGPPNDKDLTNANLLNKNLDPTILANVDPIYGAAINSVKASYGLSSSLDNTDNMIFQDSVSNTTDTTGQASATFETVRTTISSQQICPNWMYDRWLDWGEWMLDWDFTRDVFCKTEETVTYSGIRDGGGQDVILKYKCGKIPFSVNTPNVIPGTEVTINCYDQMSKYGIMYLEIADNGVITITNSATNDVVWSFTPKGKEQDLLNQSLPLKNGTTVRLNAPRPDWVNKSGVTTTNKNHSTILFTFPNVPNGLTTFSPNEFLSSPSGYCRLKLVKNNNNSSNSSLISTYKFVIQYSLYNLALDNSNYAAGNITNATPGDESFALYYIDNIQANNVGGLSYIDMNNNVFTHNKPSSGYYSLGDSYIESKNYLPSNIISPSSVKQNVSPEQCGNICTNDDNCGAYTSIRGNCATFSTSSIYPNNLRIYTEGASTFLRDKKVTSEMTHPTCSKRIANTTNDVYNNFGSYITGASMTNTKKCGMAVVLDNEIQNLNNANAAAISKGKAVKDQINNIYEKQNNAINDLQTNNMLANVFEDVIKDVDTAIETKEENALTIVAAKDNTDLILLSDNYKYIIWGIITLLLSIGAIKALRIGSR